MKSRLPLASTNAVLALENLQIGERVIKNRSWPTDAWNRYWSGDRDLSLSGVSNKEIAEQKIVIKYIG